MTTDPLTDDPRRGREPPAFNVPGVVLALLAFMAAIHAARYFISPGLDFQLIATFAFIPARYVSGAFGPVFPGGIAADIWTWVTYSLLHADTTHIVVNSIWFVAFGSPVARRFGTARFLALSVAASAAGAAAHLATHLDSGEVVPVIGASAVVSAYMGAAVRFVFDGLSGLGGLGAADDRLTKAPAKPLLRSLRNPPMLGFLLVWFAVNLVFGIGAGHFSGEAAGVAWEAHIGGFLMGLIGFRLFDPVSGVAPPGDGDVHEGPPGDEALQEQLRRARDL